MTRTAQQERKARQEAQADAEELDKAKRKTITTRQEPVRQRIAAEHIHTVSPEGVNVTFIPGEAIPDWVPDEALTSAT